MDQNKLSSVKHLFNKISVEAAIMLTFVSFCFVASKSISLLVETCKLKFTHHACARLIYILIHRLTTIGTRPYN